MSEEKVTDTCWTCGEPHEGAKHDCVASLKARIAALEAAIMEEIRHRHNVELIVAGYFNPTVHQ